MHSPAPPPKALLVAIVSLRVSMALPYTAAAPSPPSGSERFTALLQKRLAGGGSIDDVVAEIRWPYGGQQVACRVYGSGVGIWNRSVQFRLSASEARSLFENATRSGFGSLPGTLGGDPTSPRRQKGRVEMSVGGVSRVVVQLDGGKQSDMLQRVADGFLLASSAAARTGIRVSSFRDAFDKLASGTLAPEALQIVLRRASSTKSPETRTLTLNGRRSTLTVARHEPGETRWFLVSEADYASLLHDLQASHLDSSPSHFSSRDHLNLRIQVLDRVRVIDAGPPSLASETAGDRQRSFDRIVAALVALPGGVDGQNVAPTNPPRPTPGR